MATTKVGQFLAKTSGIKLHYRDEGPEVITRGESVFSIVSADEFVEEAPTSVEWVKETLPIGHDFLAYCRCLFPFTQWIGRYNLQWFYGDLIAGITTGAVVVPQGMAYALLANLPAQFGLYASFMGCLVYWFFGTSKDITIGPVAVMSTVAGTIVAKAAKSNPDIPGHVIASALSIIAGSIICFIGLTRCGWIVDFIPLTAISAFMTGSALNIAVGQVPTLMGITGFSSRDSTYKVVIHTLQHLGRSTIDAAIGLTALFLLYTLRYVFKLCGKKYANREKLFFFLLTLRTVFVILLYTFVSWLVNRHHTKHPSFKLVGTIPRGFKYAAVPKINITIIKTFAPELPAAVIVLLLEHISIAKSFGRVNNYIINPSQEMVAIGATNIFGPFLGAYPVTGSFSRTAIKSKAGVRTPLSEMITAVVVLLATYALPAVFFYIPSAALSAVIIHAIGDLITRPNTVYRFWLVSPIEVIIFFAGVIVTVFTSIENGIYTTVCTSAAVFLYRVAKAKGRFLGRVKVHSILGDLDVSDHSKSENLGGHDTAVKGSSSLTLVKRDLFLPFDHEDGSNPDVEIQAPYPGIFIYRFLEGFNYLNCSHYLEILTNHISARTRQTNVNQRLRPGDRPWNDAGPRRGKAVDDPSGRPTLKAIILDFSSVNNVDITSVQRLVDIRNQLKRYASPNEVDWHLACVNNRWTKRALVSAGFGYPTPKDRSQYLWKPIFSVAEIVGANSSTNAAEGPDDKLGSRIWQGQHEQKGSNADSIDIVSSSESSAKVPQSGAKLHGKAQPKIAVVHGLNRPLFHIDLTSALESAIAKVQFNEEIEMKGGENVGNLP